MFSKRTGWKLTLNDLTRVQGEMIASHEEILDLTASNPTRVGLNYDGLAILDSLTNPAGLDYDPQSKGLLAARRAVSHYYREQHDIYSAKAEDIVLTSSTSEGYSHIFRLLCNPGDEILVPKPSYPLFDFLADLTDVKPLPYPLIYDHGWQIDFASLYKAVSPSTRSIVVVHPNNPTGSYVREYDFAALNAFCREYSLALVVDEVFLDYALDGADRRSFAANIDALTFTMSGLSKISGLPQMKLAWIVANGPEEQRAAAVQRLEIIADTFLSLNTPVQLAAPKLLDQRKHIQPLLLDRCRANLEELDLQLSRATSCQRLAVEGGWYAVLRVPVTQTDEELAVHILKERCVLVHPGHFYDFPQDGYLIVSLITPTEAFRQGVRRIIEFVNSL